MTSQAVAGRFAARQQWPINQWSL